MMEPALTIAHREAKRALAAADASPAVAAAPAALPAAVPAAQHDEQAPPQPQQAQPDGPHDDLVGAMKSYLRMAKTVIEEKGKKQAPVPRGMRSKLSSAKQDLKYQARTLQMTLLRHRADVCRGSRSGPSNWSSWRNKKKQLGEALEDQEEAPEEEEQEEEQDRPFEQDEEEQSEQEADFGE